MNKLEQITISEVNKTIEGIKYTLVCKIKNSKLEYITQAIEECSELFENLEGMLNARRIIIETIND